MTRHLNLIIASQKIKNRLTNSLGINTYPNTFQFKMFLSFLLM